MIGASRDSLAALRESLDSRRLEAGFDRVPADLLAVSDLLSRETLLRAALADSGQSEQARTALANEVLASRLAPTSLAVVVDVVRARWSEPGDLVSALEELGAQAAFTLAEADGSLDRVEEELFRFGRAAAANPQLQMALTDPGLSSAAKAGIARDLVAGRVAPMTALLLEDLAGHLRGRRVDTAVAQLCDLAAAQRQRVVAEVTVAVPLAADQARRLAAALSVLKGRQVRLNVTVDPAVLGGVSVHVADDVIDGTVATRLEQARRALTD
ncbi:MAG: F0F1 ATP synthase subunit delta [Actinomycetota bacterium]|nr:MAG: F0F1 ATP synthase subunit delta [Actinomycetota bacterium]